MATHLGPRSLSCISRTPGSYWAIELLSDVSVAKLPRVAHSRVISPSTSSQRGAATSAEPVDDAAVVELDPEHPVPHRLEDLTLELDLLFLLGHSVLSLLRSRGRTWRPRLDAGPTTPSRRRSPPRGPWPLHAPRTRRVRPRRGS